MANIRYFRQLDLRGQGHLNVRQREGLAKRGFVFMYECLLRKLQAILKFLYGMTDGLTYSSKSICPASGNSKFWQ